MLWLKQRKTSNMNKALFAEEQKSFMWDNNVYG